MFFRLARAACRCGRPSAARNSNSRNFCPAFLCSFRPAFSLSVAARHGDLMRWVGMAEETRDRNTGTRLCSGVFFSEGAIELVPFFFFKTERARAKKKDSGSGKPRTRPRCSSLSPFCPTLSAACVSIEVDACSERGKESGQGLERFIGARRGFDDFSFQRPPSSLSASRFALALLSLLAGR